MLPFLKPKFQAQGGVMIDYRKPDEDRILDESGSPALEACAQDIISAIQSSDAKGLAQALKSAFDVMGSEPHEEAPQTEE